MRVAVAVVGVVTSVPYSMAEHYCWWSSSIMEQLSLKRWYSSLLIPSRDICDTCDA